MSRYDIVLWGATGFTGKLVAEYLARTQAEHGARWAIAGRKEGHLRQIQAELAPGMPEGTAPAVIVADATDVASLSAMARQAKVVCTTVGPYGRYGRELVGVCVEEGAHYCDLTGEVPFMSDMIDAHHEAAAAKELRIVHACGFDSIPSDIGTFVLQQAARTAWGRPADRVGYYLGRSRMFVSGGTIATLLTTFEDIKARPELRRILGNPNQLLPPPHRHAQAESEQAGPRKVAALDGWTAPFVMGTVNTRVVRRSNHLLHLVPPDRFCYHEAAWTGRGFDGFRRAVKTSAGLGGLMVGMAVGPLRRWLEENKLPKPGEGPDREQREAGNVRILLVAEHPEDPSQHLSVRFLGELDPGYGLTAVMLAQSALCLAQDDLDGEVGVVTPASAMGEHLATRLRASGIAIEVEPWPLHGPATP